MNLFLLTFVSFLALMAYVRLAPSPPEHWHIDPSSVVATEGVGIVQTMKADLSALESVVRSTPRVRVLAGSVAEGHITYVVRSLIWGFPDYVTAKQIDGKILVYSRQRFGGNDWGVNAARLAGWANALGLSAADVSTEAH